MVLRSRSAGSYFRIFHRSRERGSNRTGYEIGEDLTQRTDGCDSKGVRHTNHLLVGWLITRILGPMIGRIPLVRRTLM